MAGIRFKELFLIGLLGLLPASCAASLSQSPVVIATGGVWLGGWLSGGDHVLLYTSKELYVISIDSPSLPRIQNPWDFSRAAGSSALLSPDEMSLLYSKAEEGGCLNVSPPCINLYRMDAPGNEGSLLLSSVTLSKPVWSPDSQRFAVVVDGGLRLYDRDGHSYRELPVNYAQTNALSPQGDLVPVDDVASELAWSPDGKTIAFSDSCHVRLVDAETGSSIETGGFPREGIQPSWSPDGQYLAYIESDCLRREGSLVIVRIDGSQKVILAGMQDFAATKDTLDEFLYSDPVWSPRGTYIAARRIKATVHDFQDPRYYELVVIPVPDLK